MVKANNQNSTLFERPLSFMLLVYIYKRCYWRPPRTMKTVFSFLCSPLKIRVCPFVLFILAIVLQRGRRGRDRMVVGFTTTYVISAYHHCCCEIES